MGERRLLDPEPPPIHADGDVWAEVIAAESDPRLLALFEERRTQGIAKYGTTGRRRLESGGKSARASSSA